MPPRVCTLKANFLDHGQKEVIAKAITRHTGLFCTGCYS